MEIGFTNFAKAGSGKIRINDLTVIFGPNNTGKTYINYAIYSILENFSKLVQLKLSDKVISKLIDELKSSGSAQLDIGNFIDSMKKIKTTAVPILESNVHEYFQIPQSFFSDTTFTIKLNELNLSKQYQFSGIIPQLNIYYKYNYKNQKGKILFSIKNMENGEEYMTKEFISDSELYKLILKDNIIDMLYSVHFSETIPHPFSVTSERTGISLFYKIYDDKNSRILRFGSEMKKAYTSPDTILDLTSLHSLHALPIESNIRNIRFYEKIIEYQSEISKNNIYYKDIIEILELLLENGSFEHKDNFIYFKTKEISGDQEISIPLHATSSSVKSLFLMDLFIKNIASRDNILIIDEPELNLCVENQIIMARLVARLVNTGVKILITTHSDYFIREINNMITLSHASEKNKSKMMDEYDIRECDLLEKSQVSAYRSFENGEVKEMKIYKTGIDSEFWNNPIQRENKKSQDIFFASGVD